jgi:hypothetical protein
MTNALKTLNAMLDADTHQCDAYFIIRSIMLDCDFIPDAPYYAPSLQIAPTRPELIKNLEPDFDLISLDATQTAQIINTAADLLEMLTREEITELALSLSLCPIHLHDYAICFDDEFDDCAQIRIIHPTHDT